MTDDLASSLDAEPTFSATHVDGTNLMRAFEVWLLEYERLERAEALQSRAHQGSTSEQKTSPQPPAAAERPGAKKVAVTVDLVAYLDSIGPDLLDYLDDHHSLALGTVEHLYRCGVALLRGETLPGQVAEEWEDFFPLAEAFVYAYGSERLHSQNRKAPLLATGRGEAPSPLTGADRSLLVDLVRELGDYVVAYQSFERDRALADEGDEGRADRRPVAEGRRLRPT